MFIYNVTSKVSWQIHESWLEWLIGEHIPEVLLTGCFARYQLVRLQEVDDIDGPTYAVQYYLENRKMYDDYIRDFAAVLRDKSIRQWGDSVIAFRTLMEVIN
jgi:Domain of unknown function (DUF4286)